MSDQASPQERRIILRHADAPNYSNRIGCYLREGGYTVIKKAFAMHPLWRELIPRLPASGLLPDDKALISKILSVE